MNSTITSAAEPPVVIRGSRLVPAAPAALPARSLGLGPFQVEAAASGLPQLVDARGEKCGVFANEQLARRTAQCLSQ